MYDVALFHWLIQNRQHNQENTQWSPDPLPCEKVGSGHKTTIGQENFVDQSRQVSDL